MESDLVKAWFALFIVGVSLIRLLDDNEYFRLTAMKKIWGRSNGLFIPFFDQCCFPDTFCPDLLLSRRFYHFLSFDFKPFWILTICVRQMVFLC